jgi:parafibromin
MLNEPVKLKIAGEITQKYFVVDGVEAIQKFGQDAW